MSSGFKGQVTIEFLVSTLFFILILGALLFSLADYVPQIEDSNKRASINLEAKRISSMMLSSPGRNSSGQTGWEVNPNEATFFGLASDYHVVERDKIDALGSFQSSKFNYSQFLNLTDVESQYRMVFTVLPAVDTSESFLRTEPPNEPDIEEPDNPDYSNAGNQVHYGSLNLEGTQYNFLVTSHNGEYDTVYVVSDPVNEWVFDGAPRYNIGDKVSMGGNEYGIRSFQNRGDKQGTLLVLSRELKTFGSSLVVDATIVKLNRYAVLKEEGSDLQPLKVEVFAWRQ